MDKPYWTVGKIRDALEALALTHQHEGCTCITMQGPVHTDPPLLEVTINNQLYNPDTAQTLRIGPHGIIKE